jgi:nucleoside-diphosphate-sugar epimerase
MTNVFVTGASGFIGMRLVHELLKRGDTVHALVRSGKLASPPGFLPGERPNFDHPNLKLFGGDITNADSLRAAMRGCSQVFHLAGYAKNWARDRQTYTKSNVEGLRNVCDVAQELGVQRMVWTSTMLTFGPTAPGQIGDETLARTAPCFTDYETSKMAAENLAAKYVERGLPLVIANPGRVFGPGHLTEGNSLSLIIDMYDRGRAPVLLAGGRNVGNYVLVDDVVQGLLLAAARGRVGEKYLLGGENVSLKEFFRLIDGVSGKRHFQITIRRPGAMAYAWLARARARWIGGYPQITPEWVRLFLVDWAFSSAKAQQELGYHFTPLRDAVRLTYEWLLRVRAEKEQS